MSSELQLLVSALMLIMARISTFLAVVPVFSAARIPQSTRAYIAIGLSAALLPLMYERIVPSIQGAQGPGIVTMMLAEVLTGLFLGFLLRLIFLAIFFAAEVLAQVVGFVGMAGPGLIENELSAPLANLVTLLVAVLFFTQGLHHQVIENVVISYDRFPIGGVIASELTYTTLSAALTKAFAIVMPLTGPFLVYAVVCNVLVGLANRLVPQVPIQLVTGPAILFGALIVALLAFGVGIDPIIQNFSKVIVQGE